MEGKKKSLVDKRDSVIYNTPDSQLPKEIYVTFENNKYHAWSRWMRKSNKEPTLLLTSMTPIRIEYQGGSSKAPKLVTTPPEIVDLCHSFLRDALKGAYEGLTINAKLCIDCLTYGKKFGDLFYYQNRIINYGVLPANIYEARTMLTNAIEKQNALGRAQELERKDDAKNVIRVKLKQKYDDVDGLI